MRRDDRRHPTMNLAPTDRRGWSRTTGVAFFLSTAALATLVLVNERTFAFGTTARVDTRYQAPTAFTQVSPDGRFAAIERFDPAQGTHSLRVVECATGRARTVTTPEEASIGAFAWSSEGLLRVRSCKAPADLFWLDSGTLEVVRTTSLAEHRDELRSRATNDGWSRILSDERGETSILWIARDVRYPLPRSTQRRSTLTSRHEGVVIDRTADRRNEVTFTRRELATGETKVIAVVRQARSSCLSSDGQRLAVFAGERCTVYDAVDARELQSFEASGLWGFVEGDHDRLLVQHGSRHYARDLRTGSEIDFDGQDEVGLRRSGPHVQPVDGGRWLVHTKPDDQVELVDATSGRIVRRY